MNEIVHNKGSWKTRCGSNNPSESNPRTKSNTVRALSKNDPNTGEILFISEMDIGAWMFTSALFRIEPPHYRLSEFHTLAAAVITRQLK
jgi:hypothetical protein